MTQVAEVMTRGVRALSPHDISEPSQPDRSGTSQASGSAGGGSASGHASRKPS